MKKLLFVHPVLCYGGASKMIASVANFAAKKGFEVTILTLNDSTESQYLEPSIIHEHRQLENLKNPVLRYIEQIHVIKKYIKRHEFDLVISFVEFARTASVIASKLTHTKCLVSERVDPYMRNGRFNKVLYYIFGMADAHVFQTKGAKEYFPNKIQSKSRVIPNPVVTENIIKPYEGERNKVIVNVARLELRQKRQDLLIDAFGLIADEFPEYSLKLYGDGPDEENIKKLIDRSLLNGRVKLMGQSDNVYEDIKKASLFVLSSDYEGIPNAVIEAMSIGLPVVSTKCSPGGAEMLIQNGENGLLAERDDVESLAKCIKTMLADKDLATKMSISGMSIIDKFDESKILEQWVDYIESL